MPGAMPGCTYCPRTERGFIHIMDALLNPMNWSMTYGPYELHNWQEYVSFCEQLCAGTAFYHTDADDYMEYTSSEVI